MANKFNFGNFKIPKISSTSKTTSSNYNMVGPVPDPTKPSTSTSTTKVIKPAPAPTKIPPGRVLKPVPGAEVPDIAGTKITNVPAPVKSTTSTVGPQPSIPIPKPEISRTLVDPATFKIPKFPQVLKETPVSSVPPVGPVKITDVSSIPGSLIPKDKISKEPASTPSTPIVGPSPIPETKEPITPIYPTPPTPETPAPVTPSPETPATPIPDYSEIIKGLEEAIGGQATTFGKDIQDLKDLLQKSADASQLERDSLLGKIGEQATAYQNLEKSFLEQFGAQEKGFQDQLTALKEGFAGQLQDQSKGFLEELGRQSEGFQSKLAEQAALFEQQRDDFNEQLRESQKQLMIGLQQKDKTPAAVKLATSKAQQRGVVGRGTTGYFGREGLQIGSLNLPKRTKLSSRATTGSFA